MRLPWILLRYILREMGKTCILAVLALTGVFGLGGGLLNMIKLGEVTPDQLFRLTALVLPLAAALTLPIAVLFSATSAYGRLSADNEFVACRASGINLYILLLPPLLLSMLSAGVSFALTCYVVPSLVRNLNAFLAADVGTLIQQRLNRPQGITLGGRFRIHADECAVDPASPNAVYLTRVAFVEVDQDEWVRYGTAQQIHLSFDREAAPMRITGSMTGLSYYDRKQGQFVEERQQVIPPTDVPSPVPLDIKFLTLGKLFHYLSRPAEWAGVKYEFARLRLAVSRRAVHDILWREWRKSGNMLTLADTTGRYTVSSPHEGAQTPPDRALSLADVTVIVQVNGATRRVTADRGLIEVVPADSIEDAGLRFELHYASLLGPETSGGDRVVTKRSKYTLGPVAIPPEWVAEATGRTDQELLGIPAGPEDRSLLERQNRARTVLGETTRSIVGTIHERLSFSVSVLVLVILGAVLGIVFRNAHVMTTFGISFVPLLIVIIAIVAGKQMSRNESTYLVGLAVMWSGIALVAALDFLTLTRILRR